MFLKFLHHVNTQVFTVSTDVYAWGGHMSLKTGDVVLSNSRYKEISKDIKLLKDSLVFTAKEVQRVNDTLDSQEKASKIEEGVNSNWAHVPQQSEYDRYPLVRTSDPGIEVETQVLLKKLNII